MEGSGVHCFPSGMCGIDKHELAEKYENAEGISPVGQESISPWV